MPTDRKKQPVSNITPRYLGIPEAARYCSRSRDFIYQLISTGQLRARKVGGRYSIAIEAIDKVFGGR